MMEIENYRNAERVGYHWLSPLTILILIRDSYDQIVSKFRHCPPAPRPGPRHPNALRPGITGRRGASVWFLSRRGVEWIVKIIFYPTRPVVSEWEPGGVSLSALHSSLCTHVAPRVCAARWLRSTINHSRHRLHPLCTIVWKCLKSLDERNLICSSHQIS